MNLLAAQPIHTLSDTSLVSMTTIYQKSAVSIHQVAQHVHCDPQASASIILSISPCRSGTTILLRVFAASGVQAHFQQLKNVLRWLLQEESFTWQIPQQPTERIFLKETLGPFTLTESQFNPLQVLLEAGLPQEKLHVLIIGREPIITWDSWYQFWRGKTQVEYFIEAYKSTEKIRQQVEALGIAHNYLIYECFQSLPTPEVFKALFAQLKIPFTKLAINGWENLPAFGAVGSNIVLPEEPEAFITPNIHAPVESASAFVFRNRQVNLDKLNPNDVASIKASGILELYQHWIAQCEMALRNTL